MTIHVTFLSIRMMVYPGWAPDSIRNLFSFDQTFEVFVCPWLVITMSDENSKANVLPARDARSSARQEMNEYLLIVKTSFSSVL
jgi:hypothetical protein